MFRLHVLDLFFTALHVVIILFIMSGWAFRKTRRLHLIIMGLTVVSWFFLGLFFGLGYCFLTDWHWDVKYRLGETGLPASFITYLVNGAFGQGISEPLIDTVTVVVFLAVILLTIYVNFIRRSPAELNQGL